MVHAMVHEVEQPMHPVHVIKQSSSIVLDPRGCPKELISPCCFN
jgi:hypothetical protein